MHSQTNPKRVRVEGVPNLYRRPKDGRYEVGYTGSDGRWHIKTLEAATLTDAKRAMRAVLSTVDGKRDVAPSKVTVSAVAKDLFETMRSDVAAGEASQRTLDLYKQRFKTHVEPAFGAKPAQTVTSADIARLLRKLREDGKSSWTCHGVLTLCGDLAMCSRCGGFPYARHY